MATQTALAALAPILGLLTITRLVRLWMVVILVIALGTVNAIDDSIRQTLVPEVVGPDLLRDAVGLNSVTTNAARAVGPARRSRKGRDAHSQSTGPSSAVPSSAMCGFFSKTARPRPGTGRLPAKSRTGTEAPCCRGPNASAGMLSEGPAASGAAGRIRVHRSVSAHQAVSLASRPSESRTRSRIDCTCQTPGSTSWAPSARVASASRSRTSAGMSSSR
ncbi:MFS transporter [Streptomyces griseofuscus]|uniref:MFS transporter n=1 Tax=Streptomyces griseofuscus TaxID=146922 RepID=UPI00369CC51F